MSIRYTVRTVPAADIDAEIAASQQANYTPNYELIKRNELVRTEDKRTLIRNMDDTISDFFSFTTAQLQAYIESALANYDFPEVDMDAVNSAIALEVQTQVEAAIAALDLEPEEIDMEALEATIQSMVNEAVEDALENITVINGTDGKNAYQYAVEGGYTGTAAQFSVQLNRVLSLVDAEEIGY